MKFKPPMRIAFAFACVFASLCLALQSVGAQGGTEQTGQQIELASEGKSAYVITLAQDAIPAERTAATKLQEYFAEITGAKLPILSEADVAPETPQILIGSGARVRQLLPKQEWSTLGADGIVIQTVGKNLILTGGRPRGVLYAVYQFLEDEIGCRWWTAEARTIPRKPTLKIRAQNTTYVPPFSYREHFTAPPARRDDTGNLELAVTLRNNGHFYRLTPEWGDHYSILGFVHTFSTILPPAKYFKEHPEWYSDPKRGGLPSTSESEMPDREHTQLCMSSLELRREFIKNALELVEKNPTAGYISISENDYGPYCKCPECDALAKSEGSQSGPILNFVNEVADAIKQKAPHFWVETLAYHGSLKPPKTIRPRDNVIIRMAPIDSDYGKPLDSDKNAVVRDNLKAWSKIAPQLFIWNYVTDFSATMLPHPNLGNWANDLRFFAANNVKGIYQEGDNITHAVGDFVYLRAWIMGKLMWNPQQNQSVLINEFLRGYYGNAAPYLKAYLELIETSFQAQNLKLSTFNQNFTFLSLDTLNEAELLFNQAENAVQGDAELTRRIKRERVALEYSWIKRFAVLRLIAQGTGKPFGGPENLNDAVTSFIQNAKAFNVRNHRQNRPFEELEAQLKSEATKQAKIPEFLQNLDENRVFDLQQNVFKLWEEGTGTRLVDDDQASDGKAVEITGKVWNIEVHMAEYGSFLTPHRWRSYARVRIEGPDKPGKVLSYGIHDYGAKKSVFGAALVTNQVDAGGYQWIDFGTHALTPTSSFYFQRNEGATRVFVDRVVLVRE